jgi:S1-C subfamily serine protease
MPAWWRRPPRRPGPARRRRRDVIGRAGCWRVLGEGGERSGDGDERGAGSSDGGFGAIPDIVEEVEPSVVTVVTDTGSGSGVVYDADGTIVTNNHVVDGAGSLTVVFADQVRSPARVVATAPLLDLAILEADRRDLPPATFADELPRVGELAIAMGSPLGLEQTVTAGIVSGLNRGVPGSARITQSLVNLIQTDAPISPGNSGGALVDGRGRVIGINVAYLPPTAGAVSLGFAIPSPEVVDAVEEMLETGQVTLAYIGVVPAALTPQIAERFRLDDTQGVLVAEVEPGGPAATAGLEPGDLITSVAGRGHGDRRGVPRHPPPAGPRRRSSRSSSCAMARSAPST